MQLNLTTTLTFAGILGLAAFLGLRPVIDFHGAVPVDPSAESIEEHTSALVSYFGEELDNPSFVTVYEQRNELYKNIRAANDNTSPGLLNRMGYPLTGWKTIILDSDQQPVFGQADPLQAIRQNYAHVIIDYHHGRKVLAIQTETALGSRPDFRHWLLNDAEEFIELHIGYDPADFAIDTIKAAGQDIFLESPEDDEFEFNSDSVTVIWQNLSDISGSPRQLELEVKIDDGKWSLISWHSRYAEQEQTTLSDRNETTIYEISLVYFVIFFLGITILVAGLRNIFKGQIEWNRVALVIGLFFVISFISTLYNLHGLFPNIEREAYLAYILSQVLNAFLFSLVIALAYISWEAFARQQKQHQIEVVDNIWQGRIFTRNTGRAILTGYFSGGLILGVLAITLYATESHYHLFSMGIYGSELISSTFSPVSIIVSGIFTSVFYMLCSIVIVGSILNSFIKRDALYFLAGIPVLTLVFIAFLWGVVSIGAESVMNEALVMATLVAASLFIFRYIGLVTLLIGWSVVGILLYTLSMWGAEDPGLNNLIWTTFGILGLPFLFGLIAGAKGFESAEYDRYRPEYEEELAKRHRYEKEIQIAHDSQLTLMPSMEPKVEGLDVKGFFIPSLEVGGDYFDYDVITENGVPTQFKVAVVDVSGKGMQAAITAIFTSGLLLSRMMTDRAHSAMSKVNSILREKTHPQTFVTCLIAEYNLKNGKLSYTNAGNSQPILKRGNEVEFLDANDPRLPLGVREDVNYKSKEVSLKPGDVLLFYSDGFPEARADNGKFLGYDYIKKLIKWMDSSNLSAAEMCSIIRKKILEFSNYELADDITVVVMKVEEEVRE